MSNSQSRAVARMIDWELKLIGLLMYINKFVNVEEHFFEF